MRKTILITLLSLTFACTSTRVPEPEFPTDGSLRTRSRL